MTKINSLLASLVVALQSATLASAQSCNNFTLIRRSTGDVYYTTPSSRGFIISRGIVCEGTENCMLPTGGYVTDTRTLNLTMDESIFDQIEAATDIEFLKDFTGNVTTGVTGGIRNGTAGHIGFTPIFKCVDGTVNDCDGITEGATVMACTPAYSRYQDGDEDQDGFHYMYGNYGPVTSDRESAEALTCNPANTTAAREGQTVNNCTGTEEIINGAGVLEVGNAALASIAALFIMAAFSM